MASTTGGIIEQRAQAGADDHGRRWYRGDCHVHSVYSDGSLTTQELAVAARAAGLDFVATTDHNTAEAHSAWNHAAGDELLVIVGEEVTTGTGHWLALGIGPGQVIDWRYRVRDQVIDRYLDEVHQVGGLCVAAHPHAPYASGDFMYPFQGFDLVEVWNGLWTSDQPWNADNEAALAEWGHHLATDLLQGWWRPAMGSSDTHLEGQIGTPQTVALADDLSAGAILAALREGRCWIAESAAVQLSLTASADGGDAGIGERLTSGGKPVDVHVRIDGVPEGTVSFHTDRGTVQRESFSGDGCAPAWRTSAEESTFVRVEVRHRDGSMAALSNPIVLD